MEFIRANGRKLYKGDEEILLRGFGLGGWFLPEGYMWKLYTKCDRPRRMEALIESLCGQNYAEEFWENYFDRYITEEDIKYIAECGYNSIRMPINARKISHDVVGNGTFFDTTLQRLDRLIDWCRKWQVYVILDMHGAPGGQTGANIDDSERDLPELFMDPEAEQQLIELWIMLADRYKNEPIVAGYDLLNEPLPNWFSEHNPKLMPLYIKLVDAIRKVDSRHLIILEGLHWATDFSVFENVPEALNLEGIVLEFHKYWSNPDEESLLPFLEASKALDLPLFMGEGGENNLEWYTSIFPLYERLGISWSFWTYKKMACQNSPITFDEPRKWHRLISHIDGDIVLEREEAIEIFDAFLECIGNSKQNNAVLHALDRRVPVLIPAEAFDDYKAVSKRAIGAQLRMTDGITILFESGKTAEVDYKRYGGEPQPPEENLIIQLKERDAVSYRFQSDHESVGIKVLCWGKGDISIKVNDMVQLNRVDTPHVLEINTRVEIGKYQEVELECSSGVVYVDTIELLKG